MKQVAKYNTFKGVSTALTIGTPIITLACCGNFFVHRSDTSISAAGMFALFIVILLFKDKFAENFKMPSAFILSLVMFILLLMVEKIILPMKYVCITTMIATGVDELTFKRFYKQIELMLSQQAQEFKHVGFIFTTTKNLEAMNTK